MTLTNPIPGRGRAEQLQLRPRARFFVDFRRGVTEALTGQKPTFSSAGFLEVMASNGIGYVGVPNVPRITYTPGGLGLNEITSVPYNDVSGFLRLSQLPLNALQIAWHGLLPTGTATTPLFTIGGISSGAGVLSLSVSQDGVFGLYRNLAGTTAGTLPIQMTRQQECFAVLQLIPDGASSVRVRVAVKRRVAFDDPPWEYSAETGSVPCNLLLGNNTILLRESSPVTDFVTYRVLWQDGTNDVEDLPWGWTARRDGLPGTYGLTENGFIELVLDAGNELYFRDGASFVSIDTDPPTDYLALEPGGPSSPYIYLESLL
jgi:hypothetical protein